MGNLTAAARASIAYVCEDWASHYHGGPFHLTKDDAVRYLADSHFDKLTAEHGRAAIWNAVAAHLAANPHLLTAPHTTQAERDLRQASRDARAGTYLDAARRHHNTGLPYEALALIDRAELASPTLKDYARFRAAVRKAKPPFPLTDLAGTGLRHRTTLPLASPIAGAPVVYHGADERDWVYPGRPVIEGDWPAAIPEHCTTPTGATRQLADGRVVVCTGCGLDCT
ncbi:hypothetical protein ACFYMB_31410 [Micromonospora haikouensis]|uniref:hypothetical protein n=1 Tax=Micromonospora haikouensis TaxID=686309 RepID=UPI0036A184F2